MPVSSRSGHIRIAAAVCAAAALFVGVACSSIPGHVGHALPAVQAVPASYEAALSAGPASAPAGDWYSGFGSNELLVLIAGAAADNSDLAAAQARILQADARARVAGSALVPNVQAGANISQINGRAKAQSATETDWSALLAASYEIDFWGRNRVLADSARALAHASRADREALRLSIDSGIASSYFRVLALRERITLAAANLGVARELLQVIEARFNAGAAGAAEVATQRATVANAELVLPDLQQQETAERGALGVLAGHDPEQFDIKGIAWVDLKEPVVAAGLPSDLLQRRPDLIAAENNLVAAHADLRAAQAALFPAVTLTGSGGVQNPAVQAAVITLSGTGSTLTLGANVVQTIFDGGRRRAIRAEAEAREQELVGNYRSALRNALLDVETALAGIHHLDQQRAAQAEAVAQSSLAFDGAKLRYRAGAGDYLTVLEAQKLHYTARDQAVSYGLARLLARINLYKALGGGWHAECPHAGVSTGQ